MESATTHCATVKVATQCCYSKLIGRFDSITKIGQGSYGTVFKCRDSQTDTIVAVKRFLETDEQSHIRKIAYREIRILKKLRHPHIVTLLEVFRRRKRLHLVFEYCDRTLLDELQRTKFGLPEKDAQRVIAELLQAVEAVHQHRCLHRDIKPENILLTTSGQVKLCDFGFARSIAETNTENDYYTDYVATRWYRAPELLTDRPVYGSGVDIWAVGCVFFECLTRVPLLPGTSDIDQRYLIEAMFGDRTEAKSPTLTDKLRRYGSTSSDAQSLLTQMLRTDPSERPTAKSLLQESYFLRKNIGVEEPEPISTKTSNEIPALSESPIASVASANETKIPLPTVEVAVSDAQSQPSEVVNASRVVEPLRTLFKPREHAKLPKISFEVLRSVKSLELDVGDATRKANAKVYALRRSLSKPNFLPTIC
ncbi:Cyclin-dependent kinase-like 1 [Hypsibius exemplaris]|uniref:cyclin-dependent kinase n=1 Tax=Hypsibius exemplaris TaxID=2072580 RepID=A0A1W0WA82_HYPEX|nr:Cyclin-dependent kinase-like 1 [Hypsibius exemplaris]